MHSWLDAHQTELWSLLAVILGAGLTRLLRLKANLFYSVHHSSFVLVDQPLLDADGKVIAARQHIRSASIRVGNSGLLPARAVEVTFNWKPVILNVLPPRDFDSTASPFDRYTLKFPSLAPREQVTIEIMAFNADLPVLTAVRSEDSSGKAIPMEPQRVWPSWFNYGAFFIFVLGLAAAIYLAISLVQLIASTQG